MSQHIVHTGRCRCGAVRFEAAGDPHHVSYCHCVDCRRASGAPLSMFVGFAADQVSYQGRAATGFENGTVTRTFCGVCGSPLAYLDTKLPDDVYFTIGAMDRPVDFRPTLHAYVSQKLPYLHIGDGLPQLARTSVPRPDGSNP